MIDLLAQNVLARLSVLALLFLCVACLAYAVSRAAIARSEARSRIESGDGLVIEAGAGFGGGSLRGQASEGAWLRIVNAIERTGLSLADSRDGELRKRLLAAGFDDPVAPRVYTLVRLSLVVALPLLLLTSHWLAGNDPSLLALYFQGVGAALFGLYVPPLAVRARADRRRQAMVNGFPDALDLMLVCVEAGLGLEAAFNRVGQELVHSHKLISEQFAIVVLELRAGRSREDALRRLADRVQVDEIRSFATLLIQSTKLGSSLGQTLRVYAAEMREKRRMRAEEKAHRLPVLLSVPLVVCMLPTMIGILMLPAVIRVLRILVPAMAGPGAS